MKSPRPASLVRRGFLAALTVCAVVLGAAPRAAAQSVPLYLEDFTQGAPQGLGDPGNTFARSMKWWHGKLYVGSQRWYACTTAAIQARFNPLIKYPPSDPSLDCAPTPADLTLQGEIWAWTPPPPEDPGGPGQWDLVYRSPNDVPIPNTTKFTSREMGFRDMAVFTDIHGVEALYVSGTSARGFIAVNPDFTPGLPPPRILRSVDGVNFEELPATPGTTLGDLGVIENINISSFNRMTTYDGKLYVIAGGDFGHGIIYAASDPALGDNAFARVSPPGYTFTYMEPFNGFLYVGRGAQPVAASPPYEVLKTNGSLSPYLSFTTVLTGLRLPAYQSANSSQSLANMHAVGNALWIGSNQPPELIRINPDDTWELFMGQQRQLANGKWKYPLSGMGDGYDWYFNIHIHRMQEHEGFLYLASNDASNTFTARSNPTVTALFGSRYGFDMFRTQSGWYVNPITLNGFEDKDPGGHNNWFNYTGRTAQSTPYGLFLGTGNDQFGEQIWRARSAGAIQAPPPNLEGESAPGGVLLSWAPTPGAVKYRIYRSDLKYWFQLGVPIFFGGTLYPTPFVEWTTTTDTSFVEPMNNAARQYYVVAESADGSLSNPSNLVRLPSLMPAVRFSTLLTTLQEWQTAGQITPALFTQLKARLQTAQLAILFQQYAIAEGQLAQFAALSTDPGLVSWRVNDLQAYTTKIARRVQMAKLAKINWWTL